MDYILNGKGHGGVAEQLLAANFDTGILKPFIEKNRSYVTVNAGGGKKRTLTTNAPATLRRDEWIMFDDTVLREVRLRLRAVADVRGRGLVLNVPNGMGKTILEGSTQVESGSATISMDGIRKGEQDRPEYDVYGLPLPIIHSDFGFTARQIATSRNSGQPLDVTQLEMAARKCAETAEGLLVGTLPIYKYAGYFVYGYLNHPGRNTKVLTAPTAPGWTPDVLIGELLALRQQLYDDKYFGPYQVYISPNWDLYFDQDYVLASGVNRTLRTRIGEIKGFENIDTLDFLTGFRILVVQMTSDVVREVIGMDFTTLQWPSEGGMYLNFKVMGIIVPQIRAGVGTTRMGIVDAAAP